MCLVPLFDADEAADFVDPAVVFADYVQHPVDRVLDPPMRSDACNSLSMALSADCTEASFARCVMRTISARRASSSVSFWIADAMLMSRSPYGHLVERAKTPGRSTRIHAISISTLHAHDGADYALGVRTTASCRLSRGSLTASTHSLKHSSN